MDFGILTTAVEVTPIPDERRGRLECVARTAWGAAFELACYSSGMPVSPCILTEEFSIWLSGIDQHSLAARHPTDWDTMMVFGEWEEGAFLFGSRLLAFWVEDGTTAESLFRFHNNILYTTYRHMADGLSPQNPEVIWRAADFAFQVHGSASLLLNEAVQEIHANS